MSIYSKTAKVSLIAIIIAIVIFIILILGCLFIWWTDDSPKLNTIIAGLFTGLIIALCQLFQSWYEYTTIEKFKKMKVLDIRSDRDDRSFYQNLINNAKSRIDIMGVTAVRFIDDFADASSDNNDTKVLFAIMATGVNVRILLPSKTHLENDKQKQDSDYCQKRFKEIQEKYHDKFSFRYFDHAAAHSIFIVDDECIIGPVFPEISSKHTPAINFENSSPYASKYLQYFEKEWGKATLNG